MRTAQIIERIGGTEKGSPLIDWIVLTGGAVMLSVAIFSAIAGPAAPAFANDVAEPAESGLV